MCRKCMAIVYVLAWVAIAFDVIFDKTTAAAQSPLVVAGKLESKVDDATGVKLAVPQALVGAPTTKEWGRNWQATWRGEKQALSIDTINWGDSRTLQDWYDELVKKHGITQGQPISRDRFSLKGPHKDKRGKTIFFFHVQGEFNGGEVRGLSVVWTQPELESVADAIVQSFEAFPKKVIVQAQSPDRREIEEREKLILQLNQRNMERDQEIKELTKRITQLERQLLTNDQVADGIRIQRDALVKQVEDLRQKQSTWEVEEKQLGERIRKLASEVDYLTAELKKYRAFTKSVALVIGINNYDNLPGAQLVKAENDARAMRETLRTLGFTVIFAERHDLKSLNDYIGEFLSKINQSDTAFVFFAGHGMSIAGSNYVLPSDFRAEQARKVATIRMGALSEASIVTDILEQKPRAVVIVLDACRNDPFAGLAGAERSINPSIRRLESPRGGQGVYTIYSTGLNQTALDNLGYDDPSPNSVFTRIFLSQLGSKYYLHELIREVRKDVHALAAKVNHEQTPAVYDQTLEPICLHPKGCVAMSSSTSSRATGVPFIPMVSPR